MFRITHVRDKNQGSQLMYVIFNMVLKTIPNLINLLLKSGITMHVFYNSRGFKSLAD